MSKRFRPSIRAAKGRSLRPRSQQARLDRSDSNPPDSPEVVQAVTEAAEPALHDDASQPEAPIEAQPEAQPEVAIAAAIAAEPSQESESTDEARVFAAPEESAPPAPEAEVIEAAAPPRLEPAPAVEALPQPAVETLPQPAAEAAVVESCADATPDAKGSTAEIVASKPVKTAAVTEEAPASRRAGTNATDELSLSAEFFRRDEESSFPPIIEDHEHEEVQRVELSPKAMARRNRMRRVVAGVVAFAGAISLAIVGKTLAAAKPASQAAPMALVTKAAPPQAVEKPVEATKPEPKVEEVKADPKAEARPEEKPAEAKPEEKPAEPIKEDVKEEAKPAGDAAALKKETLALLNRGKLKDAIPVARRAIEADPTDALPYLYLGSALQETGKWKDGIAAYSECVRHATKGPVNECRAMGGRK